MLSHRPDFIFGSKTTENGDTCIVSGKLSPYKMTVK